MTGGWRGLIGLVCCVLAMDTAASADASADRFPLPPRQWGPPVHDTPTLPYLLIDRLELRATGGPDARMWDVQGWVGSDYNKVWFKSEGESEVGGRTEQGDAQLLYARLISPFWYVQAGVRRHWRPTPARNSLVIGAQGLAPGWFEVGASASLRKGAVCPRALKLSTTCCSRSAGSCSHGLKATYPPKPTLRAVSAAASTTSNWAFDCAMSFDASWRRTSG